MAKTYKYTTLKKISNQIKIDIVRSLANAGSGHLGGSLGLTDVFTSLFFRIMNHRPDHPEWENRDRLILSIGHVAPVLYTTLAHTGYFSKTELFTLRKLGSRLQGHPGKEHGLPGLELSAGSLGQGLSVAVGLALSAKMDKKSQHIYCILGDGEIQEGSIWEAAMSAGHYKLDNLTAIIDRNGVQIDGKTSDVMEIEPLAEKWRAFGWNVFKCDGHNFREIIKTINLAVKSENKPSTIIANTIMGKGIKAIEGDHKWHGIAPTMKEAEIFIEELMGN